MVSVSGATVLVVLATFLLLRTAFPRAAKAGYNDTTDIGIRERLGAALPPGITFIDEEGARVSLDGLITMPTVLAFAYYKCTNVCPDLLVGLADVMGKSETVPGRDYGVITISFDETDGPEAARKKKADYLKAASASGRKVSPDDWRFLTGDLGNIKRLTKALGFEFKRAEEGRGGFLHPAALVVLSEEGKVIRYLHGTRFLPFDIDMAFSEASSGRVGPSIPRIARLCFTYDPQKKTYAFSFLKVGGGVILFMAGGFAVYITLRGRKGGRKDA